MKADPGSKEAVRQLLSESILPLFEAIQNQCKQLDGLFFRTEGMIRFGGKEQANLSLRTKNWPDLEKNWLNGEGFSRQFEAGITQFNYEYHWIDFEKTGAPFNVLCLLKIEFQPVHFSIELDGVFQTFQLERFYHERLSAIEIDEISTLFVKEARAQIKEKTKK